MYGSGRFKTSAECELIILWGQYSVIGQATRASSNALLEQEEEEEEEEEEESQAIMVHLDEGQRRFRVPRSAACPGAHTAGGQLSQSLPKTLQ